MKILFLSAASSIHTVRWVNSLSELGHKITLVSLINHKASADSISEKVEIIYLPFSGSKGYYLNARSLKQIYRRESFDVVNVHYASGYGTLARIAKLPNILLSVWGSDVYDFPYESKVKEKILRRNLNYAAVIASTSHCMAEQTKKFLDKEKEIFVTPFGVDTNKFRPDTTKHEQGKFVFGVVKSLKSIYGIDMLIQAFVKFIDKVRPAENIELRIYGKGPQLDELKKLVKSCNVERYVSFKGYVPNQEVPDVLNQMDVFLLGSKSESFGVAAVEAMACGLPVIATEVDGFREVIEDKITGFLVPVEDEKRMSQYMMQLYQEGELRKNIGIQGRKRVEKLYDWKENVNQMIEIYKSLTGY